LALLKKFVEREGLLVVGADEALGLSTDPATAAVELSHIRAGSPPGSFTVTRPVVSV
jgi:hypothetical protein